MLQTLSFTQVNHVLDSWMLLQTRPNYVEEAGISMFKKFFESAPDALPVFSLGRYTELNDEFFKSPRLLTHARFWMKTFNASVDMMGPDLETMYETLTELGNKHERLGVTSYHYRKMGDALVDTIEELLGEQFTPQCKQAWKDMWYMMADTMMRGAQEGIEFTPI